MNGVQTADGAELVVAITSSNQEDGRVLALEPLRPSDLTAARDETWWKGVRAGVLPPDLNALTLQVHPGENEGAQKLRGYFVEVSHNGRSYRSHFGTATLQHVARRAVGPLLQQNVLNPQDEYSFYLTSRPGESGSADTSRSQALPGNAAGSPDGGCESIPAVSIEPIQFEQASLNELRAASRVFHGPTLRAKAGSATEGGPSPPTPLPEGEGGPENSDQMPIFIPRDVWEESHELSRAGGEKESAAVLHGRLMRDVDSPEVFLMIDDCLRAELADEQERSVTFSGETWKTARQRLEQRRRRLKRPHEIFVGSAHGHNFFPEADEHGRRMCDVCHLAEVCNRTTAVASTADLDWHRTVFAGQPWAVLLVFGFNAREESEWRLYGLQNTVLSPRSVRVI